MTLLVWLVWPVWVSLCFCPDLLQPVVATTAMARSAIAASAASLLVIFIVYFMSRVRLLVLLSRQIRAGGRGGEVGNPAEKRAATRIKSESANIICRASFRRSIKMFVPAPMRNTGALVPAALCEWLVDWFHVVQTRAVEVTTAPLSVTPASRV